MVGTVAVNGPVPVSAVVGVDCRSDIEQLSVVLVTIASVS